MTNEQLAEQMQELIDFRDVTLASELIDKLPSDIRNRVPLYLHVDLSGQEFIAEVVHAKHRDGNGNTMKLVFRLCNTLVYRVEIDE
jgi:hypothetical protein